MTFTYDPLGGLDTDLARIRLQIGDTVAGEGPRPENGNFQDEELAGILELEGTWRRAVAASYEILAALWAKYVDTKLDDYSESSSQKAKMFSALAQNWRSQYGYGTAQGIVAVHLTRVDGYSQDIAADETVESEYAS